MDTTHITVMHVTPGAARALFNTGAYADVTIAERTATIAVFDEFGMDYETFAVPVGSGAGQIEAASTLGLDRGDGDVLVFAIAAAAVAATMV